MMSAAEDTKEILNTSAKRGGTGIPQKHDIVIKGSGSVSDQLPETEDSFTIHGQPANSESLRLMPLSVADPMAPNNQIELPPVQHRSKHFDLGISQGANRKPLGAEKDLNLNPAPILPISATSSQILTRDEYIAQREKGANATSILCRQPQGRKPVKIFDTRLKEVIEFKEKHGHCMIPHKYKENPPLGTWTDTQRRRYRKTMEARKIHASGKGDLLKPQSSYFISQEQIEQLEAIGFNFEPRLSRKDTWEKRILQIQKFKAKHGHCNVREDDKSNPGLGKWVSYVRRTFRLSRKKGKVDCGKLSSERIEQLKSIGFVFEFKEEMAQKRFRDGIRGLKLFFDKQGHSQLPQFYAPDPTLGLCVEDMRTEYRKILKSSADGGNAYSVSMPPEMVKELSEMDFLAGEDNTV